MSNIYGDILEVLQNIEEENRNREHFLNSIPSTRANLCRSVLFPNTRKFIPAEALDGTISLMPGNQNLNLFRGQKTQNYPLCVAKIYRNNPSEIDIFISRLRQIEFELVLREHPAAILDVEKSQIPSTKLSPYRACGVVGRAHENKSQILISKFKTNAWH